MINGRSLKQHDFSVALGITHLTTAVLLLNSSENIPSWVAQYGYFTALALILFCCVFRPVKGFLTGIAAGVSIATAVRLINELFTKLHGPGVDYPLGLMGAIAGTVAALIYSKFKPSQNAERGFALGCIGALGGYFLSMFISCNTVIYCGPAFSWGTYP